MSKTKFRSLGVGFLVSAILLALVTITWPFVPDSFKDQLDSIHLPFVEETTTIEETTTVATTKSNPTSTETTTSAASVVTITVESGDTSSDVARKLYEAGAITDQQEFVNYLLDQDIAENIWVGTFSIKPNSSFEEIARTLKALR